MVRNGNPGSALICWWWGEGLSAVLPREKRIVGKISIRANEKFVIMQVVAESDERKEDEIGWTMCRRA